MPSENASEKRAFETLSKVLFPLGFEQREINIYSCSLHQDAIGWLGLNLSSKQKPIEIAPQVGVRHQQLEKLVAELLDQKFHEFLPPSIHINLGYLMPRRSFLAVKLDSQPNLAENIEGMILAIQVYGLEFMKRNGDLPELYQTLQKSGFGYPHQLAMRIPAAAMLLGRNAEAISFLDQALQQMQSRTDEAATVYRRYAQRLRLRVS